MSKLSRRWKSKWSHRRCEGSAEASAAKEADRKCRCRDRQGSREDVLRNKIPEVMDYIFHQLNLKNKDDWKEKTKQAILWECICKWVFKEMTKIRTNKIATFHKVVKSK